MSISHQKLLTSQKLSGPLGLSSLKSVHEFVTLGGRMVSIAFFAFCLAIKLWEVLLWKIFTKKTMSNMANSSKNIQKTSKCSNVDPQKETDITY